MNPNWILAVLVLGLPLSGCGTAAPSQNFGGLWNTQFSNPDGTSAFAFQSVFTQAGGTQVKVTGLVFTFPAPCFSSETSQRASLTRTGRVTGRFGMTVTTMFPAENNVLTLQGNSNGTTISGTWRLTGSTAPCNGSGNFQMNQQPPLYHQGRGITRPVQSWYLT
jgi:hypothetical protein